MIGFVAFSIFWAAVFAFLINQTGIPHILEDNLISKNGLIDADTLVCTVLTLTVYFITYIKVEKELGQIVNKLGDEKYKNSIIKYNKMIDASMMHAGQDSKYIYKLLSSIPDGGHLDLASSDTSDLTKEPNLRAKILTGTIHISSIALVFGLRKFRVSTYRNSDILPRVFTSVILGRIGAHNICGYLENGNTAPIQAAVYETKKFTKLDYSNFQNSRIALNIILHLISFKDSMRIFLDYVESLEENQNKKASNSSAPHDKRTSKRDASKDIGYVNMCIGDSKEYKRKVHDISADGKGLFIKYHQYLPRKTEISITIDPKLLKKCPELPGVWGVTHSEARSVRNKIRFGIGLEKLRDFEPEIESE
ncbi:MAG: hypothetical protein KUG82_09575 [Pseudomonadales bacterium]|nr:hypothetical protein [Pseudomonadales bacterium]